VSESTLRLRSGQAADSLQPTAKGEEEEINAEGHPLPRGDGKCAEAIEGIGVAGGVKWQNVRLKVGRLEGLKVRAGHLGVYAEERLFNSRWSLSSTGLRGARVRMLFGCAVPKWEGRAVWRAINTRDVTTDVNRLSREISVRVVSSG
jgi:hypothetical protein